MSIIYESNFEYIIFDTVNSEFQFENFTNWEKNRPADMIRVYQIKEHILNNDITLIPGIISCWVKDGVYQIYDGIHRFLAAKLVVQSQASSKLYLMIRVLNARNEQDVMNDFVNLNKSICIPSIYVEDTSVLKKTICQEIAAKLCKKYPSFVSPARRPVFYNFNRDGLVDWISTWNIDFSKQDVQELAFQTLLNINKEAKAYVEKMEIETPKKCEAHDFYLFYFDRDVIRRSVEKVLT